METDGGNVFQALAFVLGQSLYFFLRQIALVCTAEVQLVAVFLCLDATEDGTELRQFHLADAVQLVVDLLLLHAELFLVGQILPLAAATHAKVLTERHGAHLAVFNEAHHLALGERVLLAAYLHVADITGYAPRHEYHHIVPVEQTFALCRRGFYRYSLQKG